MKQCPCCQKTLDDCVRCSPAEVAKAQQTLDAIPAGRCFNCLRWDGRYSTGESRINEEGFAFCHLPDEIMRAIPHATYYKKHAAAIQTHQTFGCMTWKERVIVDRSTLHNARAEL